MPYSGLQNAPVDALSSSQLGGAADEPLAFVAGDILGGAASEVVDLIPGSVLGGAADEVVGIIPSNVLGGAADEVVDIVPSSVLGGAAGEVLIMITSFPAPRTQVPGKSYTEPQVDVVYQEQGARTIDLYAGGQYGILYDNSDDLLAEGIALICETATGTVTTPPSVSIGTPANPTLLIPTTVLTGLDTIGEIFILRRLNAISGIVAPGTPVVLTVQAAALGTGTLTVSIRPLATLV